MSNENEELVNQEDTTQGADGEGQGDGGELDSQETLARETGWIPKEEWIAEGKDPKEWRSAEAYNLRGEFIGQVRSLQKALEQANSKVSQQDIVLTKLGEVHAKALKLERARTLEQLKAQKIKALRDEDHAAVVELDEQIQEVKSADIEAVVEPDGKAPPQGKQYSTNEQQSMQGWIKNNAWYNADEDAKAIADSSFNRAIDSGKSVEEALVFASNRVQASMPQLFRQQRSSKVRDGGDNNPNPNVKQTTKGRYTTKNVDESVRKMAKQMVSLGAFKNEQEYIDSLAESGFFS